MKARLKTIVLSALAAFSAFSAVTYTSCNNDKCKAIACAYNGVCKDGSCICPSGYEGPQCETITRNKFIGVWTVKETGTYTRSATFDISVKGGLTMTDVVISNFYDTKIDVSAKVQGDSLFIPQQTVANYVIQGFGMLDKEAFYGDHGQMNVYYTIQNLDNGQTDDFGLHSGTVSVWTK